MNNEQIQVGDRVEVNDPGSWTHERVFWVKALNVISSDGIRGHLLQGHETTTVVESGLLTKVVVGDGV